MNSSKKQVILCVDDDRQNLELLEALLSPLGYEIRFSESGKDALSRVQAEIPDLILLDVMMPRLSGFEVLEQLRSQERTQYVPVLLLTALNAAEDKARGLKAGCDDFITKPCDRSELIARVRSLLRAGAYRDLLEEKKKMEIALHGTGEGVVVCDPSWVISSVNETSRVYLERTDLKGLSFADLLFHDFHVSVSTNELRDLSVPCLRFEIRREGSAQHKSARFLVTREVLLGEEQKVAWFFIRLRNIAEEEKNGRTP